MLEHLADTPAVRLGMLVYLQRVEWPHEVCNSPSCFDCFGAKLPIEFALFEAHLDDETGLLPGFRRQTCDGRSRVLAGRGQTVLRELDDIRFRCRSYILEETLSP